jgi:hypothetical protein
MEMGKTKIEKGKMNRWFAFSFTFPAFLDFCCGRKME